MKVDVILFIFLCPLINELSVLPVWCLLELPLASHNCEQDKQMY